MFAFAIHALVKHAFENYCETVHRRTHEEIQSLWTGSIECSRVLLLSYINNRCLYMLASSRVSFRYRRCLCNVNIILILNIFPDSVGTSHFAISLFSSRWTLIHITTETVISREIIVSCFFEFIYVLDTRETANLKILWNAKKWDISIGTQNTRFKSSKII